MYLSYTALRNTYASLTGNDTASNLTLGDMLINERISSYCVSNGGKWWFLEKTSTQPTVASQQSYILPQDTRKIIDLYITVGTTIYSPIAVEDPALWKRILQSQLGTGDRALFYYREGHRVHIAPIPASNGNTITIRIRREVIDLSVADYTTPGTVSAISGDETITGVGTLFTAGMAGRYIRLTSGDYQWYEINTVTDATHLELVAPYGGATVSGSALTIGQMSVLPAAYQAMPVFEAASIYWQKENSRISDKLLKQSTDLFESMLQEAGEKVEGAYMMPIESLVFRDPNIPEPSTPTSSFT